ncbi:hypothetical protein BGZ97_009614 [Linnemannia gamsii]|uniref:Uncharacterized protein n=1 Tax=Linnemannia gamsii TaxID=64522 RepID=A0A9P6QMB4_9FUNG|nr:hypothetical protein BGZ97_009614 [Linnemannia gamsii]
MGLSMRMLHWAQSSGDSVKEYGSKAFPYIEFPEWTGVDSVKAYVDRLKEQLPDNGSKEGILETGKWDTAIERTETMITSWKDRQRRGNLCGELNR